MKEKARERDGLAKTSPSTPRSSRPQRPLGPTRCSCLARAHRGKEEMEEESSTRHLRPRSELTLGAGSFLSSRLRLPSSQSLPFAKGRCSTEESSGQASTGT